MHRVLGPARAATVEQSQIPVGIAFAMPQVAPHETVAPGHFIGADGGRIQDGLNAGAQLRADDLVRVHAKHPVVDGLADCEIFLPAVAQPFLNQGTGANRFCALDCIVVAFRIDQDNFIGEFQTGKATLDPPPLVPGNDNGTQRHSGGRSRRWANEGRHRQGFHGAEL